jgi:hypothetical protein
MDLFEIYRECNRTELYQLCKDLGLTVPPHASREELMYMHLCGTSELEPGMLSNIFDEWRRALAAFVLEHWSRLQNQITCPLQSKDPMSCFGCLDTQVVACIVANPSNEFQIERYLKQCP